MSLIDNQKPFLGVGLRSAHFPHIETHGAGEVEWFEVISENFMENFGRPREILHQIRRDKDIAAHGVSMNLGSTEGIRTDYLKSLKSFVNEFEPFIISDHLCWSATSAHGSIYDLLPLPYTKEAIDIVSTNIAKIQDELKRSFTIENVSTYLRFQHSEMSEWEFISEVIKKTDCGLLLDVNNVFVNARNHQFDPVEFLKNIPYENVRQIHLAGHQDMGEFLFDTHGGKVIPEVLQLFVEAQKRSGNPIPFLLEWDENIPEYDQLLTEAQRARALLREHIE